MKDENHRLLSIDVFNKYRNRKLIVESHQIGAYQENQYLGLPEWENCIYILRIGKNSLKNSALANIPNQLDVMGILYIGGHESNRITGRYNKLIKSSRNAENYFSANGYAENDKNHGHSVGSCLTTSVLKAGFKIGDCELDLVRSGIGYDELELLIGYQEIFHHLPPWNGTRGGVSGYRNG
jgi:hypothetical protein